MQLTTKKIIIGSLAVVALAGMYAYFHREFKKLKNACWYVAGGVINQIGFSHVSLTIFFKIHNKSDIPLEISYIDLNVYINELYVTNIKKPNKQVIGANSTSTVQLDINFNPADLLKAGMKNIQPLLTDNNKVIIKLKGEMTAGSGIVKINRYPIEEVMTLKEITSPKPDSEQKC
jgi:LEA14-like dessication related protein